MGSSSPSQQIPFLNEGPSQSDGTKYKEMISSLPRVEAFLKPIYIHLYKGFWFSPIYLESVMSAQEHFNPQSTDIFITSFPKTGSTWLRALTFAIVSRSHFRGSGICPLLNKVPHECLPSLEFDLAKDPCNRDLAMPLVSTHLPYSLLPKSILSSGCKIIYICRDAKDAFVSLWFFLDRWLRPQNVEFLPLEEAFDQFCKGHISYGPYWDHVLGYWRASLEFPEKILFLKYEELKRDTVACVKKLAEFMGSSFTLEEEEKGEVQKIITMCSFENLSSLEVNKNGKHYVHTSVVPNSAFFRKGEIGDWANHLTAEMGARLDNIMEEKLQGSGLKLTK